MVNLVYLVLAFSVKSSRDNENILDTSIQFLTNTVKGERRFVVNGFYLFISCSGFAIALALFIFEFVKKNQAKHFAVVIGEFLHDFIWAVCNLVIGFCIIAYLNGAQSYVLMVLNFLASFCYAIDTFIMIKPFKSALKVFKTVISPSQFNNAV